MLVLSGGPAEASLRGAERLQPSRTVYRVSVVLSGVEQGGTGPGSSPAAQVRTYSLEQQQGVNQGVKGGSLRQGKSSPKLSRRPSLSCRGGVGRDWEKMRTDRFAERRTSSLPSKASQANGEEASTAAVIPALQQQTPKLDELPSNDGLPTESATPQVVLRRPPQGQPPGGRRVVSMYGSPAKPEPASLSAQERLRRPKSVCVLAGLNPPPPVPPAATQRGLLDALQQRRRAELRACDGLKAEGPRPLPQEVHPRTRQKGGKPRPVSMTVLELKKRGSRDNLLCDVVSSPGPGFSRTSSDGSSWRLFGRLFSRPARDAEVASDPTVKPDGPKRTLASLRRSLSFRIRRGRDRGEPEEHTQERIRTKSDGEDRTISARPFSYLTGRVLSPPREQDGDNGVQYIKYQSRGKVKVMEVPNYPAKLSRPSHEEPSVWRLLTSRFKKKDQPSSSKCELHSETSEFGKHPLAEHKNSQPVSIETLTGMKFSKGQGKLFFWVEACF
ncbi:hypothetical protein AGOR_G00040120 [Albula goreensis]|uniref:Uncharacterized protein n=1 Tax=Albula goreensis TaxID=1534307 RepID=A0A8T3DYA6_9TELE|nr:hypothetical protein AGOR_G00040120 [Albula goreensis]